MDPDRNVITRSMGVKPQVQVDIFPPIQLAGGDRVLLCSDGLTDMLDDPDILHLVGGQAPKRAAKRLIDAANKAGGIDNISVVLAQVGDKSAAAAPARTASGPGVLDKLLALPFKKMAVVAGLLVLLLLVVAGISWAVASFGGRGPAAPATQAPAGESTPPPGETTPGVETPGAAETPAPGGATSTPRSARNTPAPGEPTESPRTGGITLLAPPEGRTTSENPVSFQWQGSLRAGQSYRFTAWHPGSGDTRAFDIATTSTSLMLPGEKFGKWKWQVAIVQGEQTVVEPVGGRFYFQPVGGGDGGGGGDDGGGDDGGGGPED